MRTLTSKAATLWSMVLVLFVFASGARCEELAHVRSGEGQLRDLVDFATARSGTFRSLLDQLNHSDVVVFLKHASFLPFGIVGRVRFVSHVENIRYLQVELDCRMGKTRQLEFLGHELQHAVEIARAAEVTNPQALLRLYRRIGYATKTDGTHYRLDSPEAIEIGGQILRELQSYERERRGH